MFAASLAWTSAQAQTSLETNQAGVNARIDILGAAFTAPGAIGSGQSRIVVYRTPTQNRLTGATGVFVQGQYHTSLVPGGYSQLCMAPGPVEIGARQIQVGRNAKDAYDSLTALQLPSAQTQYLAVVEEAGRPVLKPVAAAQAMQELAGTRLQSHTISRVAKAQDCITTIAPAAPQNPVAEQITLPGDALFAFGKSDRKGLTAQGLAALDQLVARLNQDFTRIDRLHIMGHADPLGSASANERLSYERAHTVRMHLQSPGQISAPMTAEGRGSRQPIVSTCGPVATPQAIACNQPNRRVVIEITGQRR